ncbi:MAG: RluA family pseudouridine synthase [Actinomycetota bacterium]|nr:MAG: 23S rRNA pseudouridine [Actinomycetota bacterium]MDO8949676.1 RluA family pseudouridine synthase [Actinomycetota bacterium]MDP3629897.1 RluA family pseudouridine synthase [Actinomycetota bacterium]
MSSNHTHTVRGDEAGTRLDRLLGDLEFMVSRSAAQRLIEAGYVLVNGQVPNKNHTTRAGERIDVTIPPPEESDLEPESIPLDIRYEDEYLIILSKPAGLVVHPARGHWSGTLVHALLGHNVDLGTLQGEDRPGIVHRLDKDTSGLMMVAKDDVTQAALSEALKVRSVERRYVTLVHGYIAPDTGLVDAPLGRNPRDRMKMGVVESPNSKQAVTTFRVLDRYMAGRYDDGYTLVECKLYTGRTHQIRVHMAYIKHQVVGDPLYGRNHPKADLGLTRQFLHAYRLSFEHPATGEALDFLDPLTDDLASRLRALEPESMGRTPAGDEVMPLVMPARL